MVRVSNVGAGQKKTYTTRAAHGNTGDTTDLLETETLKSLARLALGTRSHLVGSVNIGTCVVGVEVLDVKLSRLVIAWYVEVDVWKAEIGQCLSVQIWMSLSCAGDETYVLNVVGDLFNGSRHCDCRRERSRRKCKKSVELS